MESAPDLAAEIDAALRAALEARDPEPLRRFLAPGVRWGEDGLPSSCRGPDEVVAWMGRALGLGLDARLGAVVGGERGVMAEVLVEFPDEEPRVRYQVYEVEGGLVTEIRGFDDAESARACAGVDA